MERADLASAILLEAGFKLIPGSPVELGELREALLSTAKAASCQSLPLRVSLIGEPDWLYASVRLEDCPPGIERNIHRGRPPASAPFERWWSSMYIRSWQPLGQHIPAGGRFLCETTFDQRGALAAVRTVTEALRLATDACAGLFRTCSLAQGQLESKPYELIYDVEAPDGMPLVFTLGHALGLLTELYLWLTSASLHRLHALGKPCHQIYEPITPAAGEMSRGQHVSQRLRRRRPAWLDLP